MFKIKNAVKLNVFFKFLSLANTNREYQKMCVHSVLGQQRV